MTRALIFGIGGQDGSYLADLLVEKNYEVHGLVRRSSSDNLGRIRHLQDRITLHRGDVTDAVSVTRILRSVLPSEVYNEADQDSVGWSHACPSLTIDITGKALIPVLEFAKERNLRSVKIFQPCSAMMFGDAAKQSSNTMPMFQDEQTRFNPQSPYAIAKVAAYHLCRYYREQHDVFVSCGILYNHDSERRSDHYLLHKICQRAVAIKAGKETDLPLGNLDSKVDVGYAPEYMDAAWRMLRHEAPEDFVIGTEAVYTVEELVNLAAQTSGVKDLLERVTVDKEFWFPGQRGFLRANANKAFALLGWQAKTKAPQLIERLVNHYAKVMRVVG